MGGRTASGVRGCGSRPRAPVPLVGVIADADADGLVVQTGPKKAAIRVSRDDVLGLEVSRGSRRRTIRGLVGGALAWGSPSSWAA
jgi:hypothetical protein